MHVSRSKRPRVSKPDPADHLLESLRSLSSRSLVRSFDRLVKSIPSNSDHKDVKRAMRLGSVLIEAGSALVEAGKDYSRKRAPYHNSISWPLPVDLTIKIFSLLSTQSVCYAAAACSFFRKCAEDPLCYSNIDLVRGNPMVNNRVVSQMTQRAGKALRSLILGTVIPSGPSCKDTGFRFARFVTSSCLSFLSMDRGALGSNLKRLYLYNIDMDDEYYDKALSACPALLDLEIVAFKVKLREKLESVSKHCPLIQRIHLESTRKGDDCLESQTCLDLVSSCPHLASLALRGFELPDSKFHLLFTGLQKLRYLDLSTSSLITGTFLRNVGTNAGGKFLEVLKLRDCYDLKEVDISNFLTAVVGGDFKLLGHLDITMRKCVARQCNLVGVCCHSKIFVPPKQLFEVRPRFQLITNLSPAYQRK